MNLSRNVSPFQDEWADMDGSDDDCSGIIFQDGDITFPDSNVPPNGTIQESNVEDHDASCAHYGGCQATQPDQVPNAFFGYQLDMPGLVGQPPTGTDLNGQPPLQENAGGAVQLHFQNPSHDVTAQNYHANSTIPQWNDAHPQQVGGQDFKPTNETVQDSHIHPYHHADATGQGMQPAYGQEAITGEDLARRIAKGERIILLLVNKCGYYEPNLPKCNQDFDNATDRCTLSLKTKFFKCQLLKNLGVTENKFPFSFYKPNKKVTQNKWMEEWFSQVTTIQDLKKNLSARVKKWKEVVKKVPDDKGKEGDKENNDEKLASITLSTKRMRTSSPDSTNSYVRRNYLFSFDDDLETIQSGRTIEDFIKMHDRGIIKYCISQLHKHFESGRYKSLSTPEEKATLWANKLLMPEDEGYDEAQDMDKYRKCCMEMLYTMCDRWEPITKQQIFQKFKSKRIQGILLPFCLPMDKAKALYFMSNAETGRRGIPWYSKRDQNFVEELKNRPFRPSINKRIIKLLEAEELQLEPYIGKWIRPQWPECMST